MNFAIVNGQKIPLDGLPDDIKADLQDHAAKGDQILETLKSVGDVAIGAAKGLARSGVRGGALLRQIPGVDALSNKLGSVTVPVDSTNTAQKVGGLIEQGAEIAAPSRAISAAGVKAAEVTAPLLARVFSPTLARLIPRMVVEGAGQAGLAKAQGATTGEAGATAAMAATIPTIGATAVAVANKLRGGAAEDVYRFFNPGPKAFKAVVEKRTPEILERGSEVLGTLGRTREGAVEAFATQRQAAGEAIDEALKTFGGDTVQEAPQRLMAALDAAKAPYVKTRIVSVAEAQGPLKRFVVGTMPDGRVQLAIPLDAAKVSQLDALKAIVQAHGNDMSVDDLVGLRRAWDEIAYAKPGATLETVKSSAQKWAKKMGGDAIRGIIASDKPDLATLNREFSFWKDLEGAMDATVQRKVGQVGGVLAPMAEQGGRIASAAAHGSIGQVLVAGKLAKLAQQVFASPRYASLAASIKQGIADALTAGNTARAEGWLRSAAARIGVVEGPRLIDAASGP